MTYARAIAPFFYECHGVGSEFPCASSVTQHVDIDRLAGWEARFRSDSNLTVDVFESLHAIGRLQTEWEDLERRTPEATGFQSFSWCFTWADTARRFGAPLRPRIITVRQAGRLVMLWPLQIETQFGLVWARGLGQPVTQYGDALAESSAERSSWRVVAEAEIRRWSDVDLLLMVQVRRDSVLAAAGSPAVRTLATAPFLRFDDPVALSRCLTPSRTSRRRERKLAQHGVIDLVSPSLAADRRAAALTILDMKAHWLTVKGYHWTSFARPFSRFFLTEMAERGLLEINQLCVGSAIVAGELGIKGGTAYRSLVCAYDIRYAFGSPGNILTRRLVYRLNKPALRGFDFLPPADNHKARISSEAIEIIKICLPLTFRGKAGVFASDFLRPTLERLRGWKYAMVGT